MPGKSRRLARLFSIGSGNLFCIPIDHGMQVGVIDGIEDPFRRPLVDPIGGKVFKSPEVLKVEPFHYSAPDSGSKLSRACDD